MQGINVCATLGGNTGKPGCDVRMARPQYIMPARDKVFTANEVADATAFKAALKTAMLQPRDSANKVFCFPLMRVVDDNTGDVSPQTLADGYEEILNELLPKYTLQSTAGVCVVQAMCEFNGWTDGVFVVDVNKILWYVIPTAGGAAAFTVGNLYTDPPRFGNSSNIQTSKTRITFGDLEEFKANVGALKLDFDPSKLVNTVDVTLVEKAAQSTNVFTIGGIVQCAGTDIYASYSAGLANIARWVVTRLDTSAAITLTSVAADATNKGWDITLDSTEYTALPSGTKLEFKLADPATLDAAGVSGIESFTIVYTKP